MAMPLPGGAPAPTTGKPAAALSSTPPPKVAVGPVVPAFEYTYEDVKAAAEDLLATLPPPKVIEAKGERHAIAVVGPRGGKTVASVATKTSKCPGLPRPAGSIAVVIHVDNQAANSFRNFLFAEDIMVADEDMPTFIPIGVPRGRYKARVSQSDPACSAYVKDVVFEMERMLGARGDVGLLVFDGYGDFCNRYGNYVCAHASGVSSPLKLEGVMWTPRREFYADNISNGLAAVCPGGWFIVNGPAGGLEAEADKDIGKLTKRLNKEGLRGRMPPSKWMMYRENNENVSATIETEVGIGPDGRPRYVLDVWDGRLARFGFITGAEVDYTGRSIAAILDLIPSTPPSSQK